jgi:hypothetical protein
VGSGGWAEDGRFRSRYRHRPSLPAVRSETLLLVAQVKRPRLVVNLGAKDETFESHPA